MACFSFFPSFPFSTSSLLVIIMLGISNVSAQLSPSFYNKTCPLALATIKTAVTTAVQKERRMGASLLRLHFHDCFVLGCDASVLLDDNKTFIGEKTAKPNANSLRGFDVIDKIKSLVETLCNRTVSCADILALAARDAVVALGGPTWDVPLGRRDSTTASLDAANTDLPSPLADLSGLISTFSNKGFTANEMVALSGGHTVGQARCLLFRNRIYNESNIDSNFANTTKQTCPSNGGDNNLAPLDKTAASFDNRYFTDLTQQRGLLHSDQQLFIDGGSTNDLVTTYGEDPLKFFKDFASAMVKMGNLNPLTGSSNGEIRAHCRKVN